jgi:hypothetical protein
MVILTGTLTIALTILANTKRLPAKSTPAAGGPGLRSPRQIQTFGKSLRPRRIAAQSAALQKPLAEPATILENNALPVLSNNTDRVTVSGISIV